MTETLFVAILVGIAVLIFFVGVWRLAPQRDPVAERLDEYGWENIAPEWAEDERQGAAFDLVDRLVNLFGVGPTLARMLVQAGVPLTVAEFSLILLATTVIGFVIGTVRINFIFGLLVGAGLAVIPFIYLRIQCSRRSQAFTQQLPDILTLLTGALRAGYGLNQALGVLVEQAPAPTSTEVARVLRAVNLGVSLQRALRDMARRAGSDDFDLIVTAINVQYETGGNLAGVLETIGDTIRDRIRILREVRALTAQQRLTGYILASLPIFLFVVMSFLSPGYFDPFFEPGLIRLLPAGAVVMMLAGFLLIRKIVDIDV